MKLRTTNRKARGGFAPTRRGDQKGQILIEVLVALAILGVVAVAFLTALTTTSLALIVADRHTTAESLTRSEIEYVQNSPYQGEDGGFSYQLPSGYPPWDPEHTLPSGFDNYSLVVTGVPVDPETHQTQEADEGIQKVTVEVYQQGQLVLTTSDYKTEQ
jgi:type II secretory pathway pseudopilin PulG